MNISAIRHTIPGPVSVASYNQAGAAGQATSAPAWPATHRAPEASPSDAISLSSRAMAISSNSSLNGVLSDIMGPRSGNSAAAMDIAFTSRSNDPAASFRSAEKVPLEGYDQIKLDNPDHKTPKYIFGRVAQGFSLDSVNGDKTKAEEILKAMLPELKAAGLEIVAVKGDKIQVKTEHGYEWVDVVRGAGDKEHKPGWYWGSEAKGTPNPTASPQEWAAQSGAGGGGASGGGGGAAPIAGGVAPASGPKATPLADQIDRNIVTAALQKYPVGNQGLAQGCADLQQHYPGVSVVPHANTQDKLKFPNGAVIDVIIASKTDHPKWGYLKEN